MSDEDELFERLRKTPFEEVADMVDEMAAEQLEDLSLSSMNQYVQRRDTIITNNGWDIIEFQNLMHKRNGQSR